METKNCLPTDGCTKQNLDLFFANGLYNSCQATDELIKSIEESQDDALAKKALALYQRHYSTLDRPWDHVTFMYGLGLIYMHFNAYNWAVKAFREAIYVQPNFIRSRDIHTRLGLIFKATGRHKLSEKHFNLAINDTRPNCGTSTNLELEFHLAHLYEIQGKLKEAKEAYERLLQKNDLPRQLSANIHRQLGWMYFYTDADADKSTRNSGRKKNMFNQQNSLSAGKMVAALNCLNTSYRTDSDPKTSYYLGRCFTNIGKFQDAFASYRSVIDREESTADTWCSIGVLYHQQNQPTDALQAYIRSVQFDKQHSTAWMNLGILYESHNQFHDALKCYQHVLRCSSNGIDRSLQARIKYIQKQMAEIENSLSNNGKLKISSDKLLSLEDLWNLESKTSLENSSNQTNNATTTFSTTAETATTITNTPNFSSKIPIHATSSSIPRTSINPSQNSNQQHHEPPPIASHSKEIPMDIDKHSNGPIVVDKNNISLLNNCANKVATIEPADSKSKNLQQHANTVHPNLPPGNHISLLNNCKLEISTQVSQDLKPQSIDSKDFCLNQVLTNGASKDSGISSNSSTYAECALIPSQSSNVSTENYISAEQVIEACKSSLEKLKRLDVNLLMDDDRPPQTFPRPPPYPPLPPDKLFPSPPSIFLETKKEMVTKRLQECCLSSPISIVRNIASVLKLDLGLFSTKTLVESNPDHHLDVLSHLHYQPGEVIDGEQTNHNVWACDYQISSSTISRYASYQVASFRESLIEERESKLSSGSKASLTKESETDSNESNSTHARRNNQTSTNIDAQQNLASNSNKGFANKKFKKDQPTKIRYVKAASEIDLSDDKKWRPQLNELNKLPNFIKCVSASNMLTHVGHQLLGINTISMSMHVPGCRILGNQTPNNFCSVNINVGPGDYEWCAISAEYSSIFTRLCNRNGFELEEKSWWPKMSDLQKHNIPIYRFSQRPGDLVWVNSGTIYWVQATGWCNNIHWNVGPLIARQYKSASESSELNKLLFRKSDVPMIQLTWNIIININIILDDELHKTILGVLKRSLRFCALLKELVEEQIKHNIYQIEEEPGPRNAKFCSLCECEVFNIYFNRKNSENIHCVECARRLDPTLDGYDIEQVYDLKYLMKLYDNFIETKKKFKERQQQQARQEQKAVT